MNVEVYNLDDPRFGIAVYKTPLARDLGHRLDAFLSSDKNFSWNEALVGYSQKPDPSYRNCWDFKIYDQMAAQQKGTIADIYNQTSSITKACVDHYTQGYNIKLDYMEAINFVKYGPGEHFYFHSDHGFSYVCTVSTVTYLNDDYEGGELEFNKLGFKIKPEAGDIIVFPSTFIYSHASLPVTSGTKYSAVTMFDYNDTHHKSHVAPAKQTNAKQVNKTTITLTPPTFHG